MAKKRTAKPKLPATAAPPAKVEQAHGGAIYSGGVPGNRGGIGRPPSAVRATARQKFDHRLEVLDQIAGSKKASNADRTRAIYVLGRFGMDRNITVDDVRHALGETQRAIREKYAPDVAAEILMLIEPFWAGL